MRVLLVGDLRSAYNYGAIATTQSLYDLIKTRVAEPDIDTIDYRSFIAKTPLDGNKPTVEEILKERKSSLNQVEPALKRAIKNNSLYIKYKRASADKNRPPQRTADLPHIPAHYDDYDEFSKKVLNREELEYELNKLQNADIVIINGEGNIVKGTNSDGIYRTGGLYVLYMAYLSKAVLGKKTYLINHTVDPQNDEIIDMIKRIYPILDGVYIRERLSYNLVKSWGIENIKFVPDALFSADLDTKNWQPGKRLELEKIDFSKPYICLGDSSAVLNKNGKIGWDIEKTYIGLIRELQKIIPQVIFVDGFTGSCREIADAVRKTKIPCVSLKNADYVDLYNIFKGCSVFVSGRWHASILSVMAGCPIILWGADSHKTKALYDLLDYPYKFFDINTIDKSIDEICNEVQKVLADDFSKYDDKINQLRKLSKNNIDMLG